MFDSRLWLRRVVTQRHTLPLDLIEAFLTEVIPANIWHVKHRHGDTM